MEPSTASSTTAHTPHAPSKYVTDDEFEPQPSARRPARAMAANGDRCVHPLFDRQLPLVAASPLDRLKLTKPCL